MVLIVAGGSARFASRAQVALPDSYADFAKAVQRGHVSTSIDPARTAARIWRDEYKEIR